MELNATVAQANREERCWKAQDPIRSKYSVYVQSNNLDDIIAYKNRNNHHTAWGLGGVWWVDAADATDLLARWRSASIGNNEAAVTGQSVMDKRQNLASWACDY